jgi:OmpA family
MRNYMRNQSRHIILTFLTVVFGLTAYGQKNLLQKSIYFETAKFDLTTDSKTALDNLADSLKSFQTYKIFIKGNTDNIGDSIFNKKLSEQRVLATQQYFISKGISPTVFSTSAFGEEKPIGDNSTEEGKQKNRRVDISISFTRPIPIDSSQFLPSIFELYKQTERKPHEFCINPTRDTLLRCAKGTIVYVKANSFKISNSCKTNCITIKIKEDFLKSDMILDNLSTTSNGKIIETQGMVYTEANDCKGNKLNLIKGKDLVIMLPTDKVIPNAKIFQGNRTPHDSIMNWTVSNNSVLTNFSLAELNICHDWLCGGVRRCPFFFCKIRLFFNKVFGKKNNRNRVSNPPPKEMIPKCEMLEKLYTDYGVKNLEDLVNAVNKPLLDSFQVKTIAELQDTMRKINLNKVELSYLNKSLNYEDFKFYVYNTSRLGWSNVDVFVDIKPDQMVTMKINLKVAKNIDCKLVFKDRRFVIPATKEDKKYEFEKIPKGETVWIIAIKYDEGKPYLFMQETTVDNKTVDIDFKSLTLDELKEKLKVLDE